MFVTHRKDIELDGSNPLFIYSYGAFNWVSFLFYQPQILVWLEMGGIYAQPSIRGGGEYGEEWHKAGSLTNRQNAIDDYISACEWLIYQGYTDPSKLVANGGSASASLAAAAVIQRPDLFGAAVFDRPSFDMIRYNRFTTSKFWVNEFGSPQDPEEFEALLSWSPYHNIKEGVCYPPMLIMVGDKDEITVPLHSYKFVAALQANKQCKNPVLLKMIWGAGHSYGSTPEQSADSWTDEVTFLAKMLKLAF